MTGAFVRLLIALAACAGLRCAEPAPHPPAGDHPMKISWRIKGPQWIPDQGFAATLAMLREQPAVVDELALVFDDQFGLSHGYQPEAEVRRQGGILAQRIRELHAAGIASVGVNLWPSLGDVGALDYACGWLPALPFQTVVGPDGGGSPKAGCISDPVCLAHLRLRGECMAAARPDFVWIDEYRGTVCYCDRCLAAFAGGRWKDRAALVAALEAPEGGALRQDWVAFAGRKGELFARTLRATLDAVDPRIGLGLMIIGPELTQEVGDFAPAMLAAGRIGKLRPGHGWYMDYDMRGLLRKAAESGRLIQRLGAGIDDIQHEWEHWPGGTIDKSRHATVVEITTALFAGNTGVAMNDGPFIDDVDELMREDLRTLAAWRPGWDRLTAFLAGLESAGLHLVAPPDALARTTVDAGGWQAQARRIGEAFACADTWQMHGIPLSPRRQGAAGILLNGALARSLSDRELTAILGGFAILDGEAAEVLTRRGLGQLAGVVAGPWRSDGTERFTDHPCNGGYAGRQRWRAYGDGRALQAVEPGVEVLGRLMRLDGGADLGASTTCFRNRLGGRVAVLAYDAWQLVGSPHRWQQLQGIIAWGCDGDVPLRLDRLRRVAPFVRRSADRTRTAVLLLNLGIDPTGTMTITLPAGSTRFTLLEADGSEIPLATAAAGATVAIQVPDLPAWGMAIVLGTAPTP